MGLESHVNRILAEAEIPRDWYFWSNGLNVVGDAAGCSLQTQMERSKAIRTVLESSREFGPTRYISKTGKIRFGLLQERYLNESRQKAGGAVSH